MRILQVASSLYDWGGIERYVLYLTEGLRERGHDVDVTCPPNSPLDQRLSSGTIHISLKKQFSLLSYLAYKKLLSQRQYDAVHIHFSPDFIVPALAARKTKQPLLVMTRHVALPWSAAKVSRYTKLFDHIIPVSHSVEEKLVASGVKTDMMTVAKAGCPALEPKRAPEDVRSELGHAPEEFVVGSFGRLVKEKGLGTLLQAVAGQNGIKADIFGSGPLGDELRKYESRNGKLRGFVTDVADTMNAMDAIVVPSVWEEAFPYAVLEAMSLGKPVIASRVGGLPEMVEEGKTGLLFEKEDAEGLRQVLVGLAGNRETLKQMGQAALELHQSEYTVEKMAERIERVYLEKKD